MNYIKLSVIIVLCGLGYAGNEFYTFSTEEVTRMQSQLNGLDRQISSKQAELKKLQRFRQSIEAIKQELKELNIQLQSALERLPREFNLARLLRKLTTIGKNSGVELINFQPKGAGGRGSSGSFYSSTEIAFDVRGPYAQCVLFYDQITRLKRIININSIVMLELRQRRRSRSIADTGVKTVLAKTEIVTYRFTQ